jgi:hypothetical protein
MAHGEPSYHHAYTNARSEGFGIFSRCNCRLQIQLLHFELLYFQLLHFELLHFQSLQIKLRGVKSEI